jgi:hypothetical protein
VDTVKMLARDRHFYTADIDLAAYGEVLLVGEQAAVERLLEVIREHPGHDLVAIETGPEDEPG